uniref:NADH-ubiquinone oxidoreductase chain 4 n=1 Tax=Leucauge celebesiana TaxID=1112430 RepID=A0A6B9RAT8_9ARAC|nr:NADH dehydrogenase subunit 4 [Leucauge celebesiana]
MKLSIPLIFCFQKKKYSMMMILIISLMWMISILMKNMLPTFISMIHYLDFLSTIMISLTILSTLLILMSMNYSNSNFMLTSIMIILIFTFLSSKMFMFYILFELVLIPTLTLISKSGKQPERLQAGMYLIIYTVMASLPLLIGILLLKSNNSMIFLSMSCYYFKFPLIFMLAFLVKMPMFMFHLWLPKAHVEAPLEGSMILAAVLLKLGGYGLIRFMPMLSSSIKSIPLWLISISLMGAFYTSMMCIRQKDLKALIAYSSVAHMGLVLSSILTMNLIATNGSIIMMMAHGLSSAALFFLVNLIYTKFHTRNMLIFKGILNSHPNLTFWWFMFTAVNISAPPSINLISEIFMLMGLISWKTSMIMILASISIMTSSFSIMLYVMISHNNSPILISENVNSKFFLSLFCHLFIILFMVIKLELMIFY